MRTQRMDPRSSLDPCLRGAVIAVCEGKAGLVLVGFQTFPAHQELLDGNGLQHVALPGHQDVQALECVGNARSQAVDRDLVADVAVRCRLSHPDEGVVLRRQRVYFFVQFAQMLVGNEELAGKEFFSAHKSLKVDRESTMQMIEWFDLRQL